MVRWAWSVVTLAALMGAAGVAVAAAGSHIGGGDPARLAAEFLLIHAAVALALGLSVVLGLKPPGRWLFAASVMAFGTILFSADLALIAFRDARPFPQAAPIGGAGMIAGWLLLVIGASIELAKPNRSF